MFHCIYLTLRPLMRQHYNVELVAWEDPASLEGFRKACNDCFISRYTAGTAYTQLEKETYTLSYTLIL